MIHVLAVSFSDAASAGANKVTFWPMGFNTAAYELVFRNAVFGRSFLISVIRTLVGTVISLLCTILVAYPLSKEKEELWGRNVLRWIFIIPMLINGGIVPGFILIRNLGLINSIWALILPGCVPSMYIVMMMNFFRGINTGLLDSARIDGADEFTILLRIMLPLSGASMATIVLFTMVNYWNEWFGGLIFMSERSMWPLQTLLQQMMKSMDMTGFSSSDITMLSKLSDRSFRSAGDYHCNGTYHVRLSFYAAFLYFRHYAWFSKRVSGSILRKLAGNKTMQDPRKRGSAHAKDFLSPSLQRVTYFGGWFAADHFSNTDAGLSVSK